MTGDHGPPRDKDVVSHHQVPCVYTVDSEDTDTTQVQENMSDEEDSLATTIISPEESSQCSSQDEPFPAEPLDLSKPKRSPRKPSTSRSKYRNAISPDEEDSSPGTTSSNSSEDSGPSQNCHTEKENRNRVPPVRTLEFLTREGSKTPSLAGDADSPAPASSNTSSEDGSVRLSPSAPEHLDSEPLTERKNFVNVIPDFVMEQKEFNRSISCPGCRKIFLCHYFPNGSGKVPHVSYFQHCFKCPEYENLKRTVNCNRCCSTFLDQDCFKCHMIDSFACRILAERNHLQQDIQNVVDDQKNYFEIPSSVTSSSAATSSSSAGSTCKGGEQSGPVMAASSIPSTSSSSTPPRSVSLRFYVPQHDLRKNTERSVIRCEGCDKPFACLYNPTRGRYYPGRDYHVHCASKCIRYLQLKKIKVCLKCKQVFLNRNDFREHVSDDVCVTPPAVGEEIVVD